MSTFDQAFSELIVSALRHPLVISEFESTVRRAMKEELAGKLTSEPGRLLNVKEAAKFVGVGEQTIREWAGKGKLKASKPGSGSQFRIRLSDLEAAMKPNNETVDLDQVAGNILRIDRKKNH